MQSFDGNGEIICNFCYLNMSSEKFNYKEQIKKQKEVFTTFDPDPVAQL